MRHAGQADRNVDSLIGEITIDCYGDDEALSAFEVAFDEDADLPRSRVVSANRYGSSQSGSATVAAN